jgi:hypothetical protein
VIRFKSFRKSFLGYFGLSALSVLMMLAAYARPTEAQSQSNDGPSFDAGADATIRVGRHQLKFGEVAVGETSDRLELVLTTNIKPITLFNITVKEPFFETDCTCIFVSNNVGTQVDCDNASLGQNGLSIPPATTCRVGVEFEPQSSGKVNLRRGMRIDSDSTNTPRHVRLTGFGVD